MKNFKPTSAQTREVLKILDKWKRKLLLNEWFIDTIFPAEYCEGTPDGYNVLADTSVDPVYLNAKIRFYPAFFEAPNDVREHAVVHELCHCLTQEAWDNMGKLYRGEMVSGCQQRDIIERLTQRISNVAMRDHWPKRVWKK